MERKFTGDEHFTYNDKETGFPLSGFWSWFSSDLLNNITRGILAEYIVSNALGIDTSGVRQSWEPFDILYNDKSREAKEVKLEIKSSAYIQSWHKDGEYSKPVFGIAPTCIWSDRGNMGRKRKADIYIFCLLAERNREKINPINLEQWKFYVVPTIVLNEACGEQKTITLSALESLNHTQATYETLKAAVDKYVKTKL